MLRLATFAAVAIAAASAGGPVKGYFGLATPAADAEDALPKNCSRLDAAAVPPEFMSAIQDGLKLFSERPSELVEAVVHTEGPDGVHGRQLQATTCTPTLANGQWSGSPPGASPRSVRPPASQQQWGCRHRISPLYPDKLLLRAMRRRLPGICAVSCTARVVAPRAVQSASAALPLTLPPSAARILPHQCFPIPLPVRLPARLSVRLQT